MTRKNSSAGDTRSLLMRLFNACKMPKPGEEKTRHDVVIIAVWAALYLTTFANTPLWHALWPLVTPLSLDSLRVLATFFVVVLTLFSVGLSLFGIKNVFKPALAIILVAASVVSYFMDTFGVVVDRQMIQNVFETDLHEAAELINAGLCWHVLIFGLAPAILLFRIPVRYDSFWREVGKRGLFIAVCLLVAGVAIFANYKALSLIIRENRQLRMLVNPSYPLYALASYVRQTVHSGTAGPLEPIAATAAQSSPWQQRDRRRVVIFVLGETARAEDFSLDGYSRETNPELKRQDVLNFSNVHSCATSTADAVPCLFSGMPRTDFSADKARRRENLLDLLTRAGVWVLWRDNNSGSKGVADRVVYQDMSGSKDPALCPDGECFDEILLQNLRDTITANKGDLFVVLHQKGSHGPLYYKRVPETFRRFTPECRRDDVQNCSRDEIVNAYDNTILYTDHVLAKTIDLLKGLAPETDTALLYMSDHGESLGERGIYLHGAPYLIAPEEQTHIPFVAWLSDGFAKDAGIDRERLRQASAAAYSHDNLFHTVLGLFSVYTEIYRPDNDIFAPRG